MHQCNVPHNILPTPATLLILLIIIQNSPTQIPSEERVTQPVKVLCVLLLLLLLTEVLKQRLSNANTRIQRFTHRSRFIANTKIYTHAFLKFFASNITK